MTEAVASATTLSLPVPDQRQITSYDRLVFAGFGWLRRWKHNPVIGWGLPTACTLLRGLIVLVNPILCLAITTQHPAEAVGWLVLVIALACTDAFDGSFARLFDRTSKIGAVLDPVVDKIYSITLIVWFWRLADGSGSSLWTTLRWVFVLRVALDGLLVLAAGYGILRKWEVKANNWGKFKFNADVAGVILGYLTMIGVYRGWVNSNLSVALTSALFLAATFFGVASVVGHWRGRKPA